MKANIILTAVMMSVSAPGICAGSIEPSHKVIAAALVRYLDTQGYLCVGKHDWPIEVSEHDVEMQSRDAVQMPVLENLGLVVSDTRSVANMAEEIGSEKNLSVKRYALTDAGRKFYVARPMTRADSSGRKIAYANDFCAGKLSLDKLVRVEKSTREGNRKELVAIYTYKFLPAEWSSDPAARKVFPMVDRIAKGEKVAELEQLFRLKGKTWIAVYPR